MPVKTQRHTDLKTCFEPTPSTLPIQPSKLPLTSKE